MSLRKASQEIPQIYITKVPIVIAQKVNMIDLTQSHSAKNPTKIEAKIKPNKYPPVGPNR